MRTIKYVLLAIVSFILIGFLSLKGTLETPLQNWALLTFAVITFVTWLVLFESIIKDYEKH
jgi:energy-converting hydrogenase Eha subunit E